MKRLTRFTVVLFFATVMSAHAQQPTLENPVCNAQFAQILVQQQVMESKSVVEPVKRIKILLRSADFLWPFDEPTSRAYFAEAWKMADDRFKEKGLESIKAGSKDAQVVQILPDQRMEVVNAIAKRDKEWAGKLSDQMLADYEKVARDRKGFDETRELSDLLNLASENVKTSPEFSRAILRRVMKFPLFMSWYFTMFRLAQDPAFADSMYVEVLNNYRNETPRRLLYLSAYPFANERIFGIDRNSISMGKPGISPNEALSRRFLEVFFNRITAFAANEADMNRPTEANMMPEAAYMVSALNEIEPYIVNQYPDMLGRFGEARAQAASLLSEDTRKNLNEREKQNSSWSLSFEERIKQLEEADGTGKLTDWMIVSLVTSNIGKDEEFELIKPWLDKIKEEKPRGETINYYWFKRAKLAIEQKRFDDAEKFSVKVPEVEHRALLMFDIAAIQAKSETDMPALFETLNRISKMTKAADNSVAKAQILLGLSNMYEKINHSTAMDELSDAIRVTNVLKDPDIFKTYASRQIVGKGYAHFVSFGTPGYDLEKTFVELSKKDFEISLGQAKSLDDKYFKTLAVIAVASNCAKNAKPDPKAKTKAQ